MPLKKTGLERFRREISAAVDRGVENAAGHIADLAEQLVPVDSGDLKSTIRVEGAAGSRRRQVKAGGGAVDYAGFVEYGTATSPAQPYMTPAAAAIDVGQEVAREIAKLAGG